MPLLAIKAKSVLTATRWLRGLWEYYREYTHSPIHAATVAALTIFGLLIFIDPLFAALAIASYICPPIVLYTLNAEVEAGSTLSEQAADRAHPGETSNGTSQIDTESADRDSDSDSDSGDSDADGADTDSDTDR